MRCACARTGMLLQEQSHKMLSSDCWHITLHDPTSKGFASPGAAGKPLKGSWMAKLGAGAAPRAQSFVPQ